MSGRLTSYADVLRYMGQGRFSTAAVAATGSNSSGADANSGFVTLAIEFNTLGTTLSTTLVDIPSGNVTVPQRCVKVVSNSVSASIVWLARVYLFGTLDMTATGNKFTHDAATFPVTRTVYGVASQPLSLIPMLMVHTANTTTAPAFILKNTAPSAGYVNQDGSNVTGTKTFTFSNATQPTGVANFLRLETGDSSVNDITQIDVTTSGTNGTADIFGVEFIAPIFTGNTASGCSVSEFLSGGLALNDLSPAVATSGTVTSYLVVLQATHGGGAQASTIHIDTVLDT